MDHHCLVLVIVNLNSMNPKPLKHFLVVPPVQVSQLLYVLML